MLDLAGGPLPFVLQVEGGRGRWTGRLCNGAECQAASTIRQDGDSLVVDLADYAATIVVAQRGDSLVGRYSNVGRRGPRTIPLRASRGAPSMVRAPSALVGRWDAWFQSGFDATPRVLLVENAPTGVEGTVISNSGDYGRFGGEMLGDTLRLGHFDGSFVYLLTAHLEGDTLRGTFHAGLRSQTPFVAVRSTGQRHLTPPTEVTRADSTVPFSLAVPDLDSERPLVAAQMIEPITLEPDLDPNRLAIGRKGRGDQIVGRLSQITPSKGFRPLVAKSLDVLEFHVDLNIR